MFRVCINSMVSDCVKDLTCRCVKLKTLSSFSLEMKMIYKFLYCLWNNFSCNSN